MSLVNLFMSNVTGEKKQTSSNVVEGEATKNEFSKIMDKAENSIASKKVDVKRSQQSLSSDNKGRVDNFKQSKSVKENRNTLQRGRTEGSTFDASRKPNRSEQRVTSADGSASEVETQQTSANSKSNEVSNEIVNEVAQLLASSSQMIMDILNSLEMVPSDLTDKSNLNLFLQKFFNMETAVELLDVPEISNIMKNLTSILDNAEELIVEQVVSVARGEKGNGTNEVLTEDLIEEPKIAAFKKSDEQIVESENDLLDENVEQPAIKTVENDGQNQEQNETMDQNAEHTLASNTNSWLSRNAERFVMSEDSNIEVPISTPSSNVGVAQTVSKVRTPSNVSTTDIINQIVNKMKVDVRGNLTEVRIVLTPEHLGDVSMKVAVQNGIVTAKFVAENQRVKEIIESNFEVLKESLQKQGIEISSLSVSVGQDQNEAMMKQFEQSKQKSSRRIQQIIDGLNSDGVNEAENYSNIDEVLENTVSYTA